MIFNNHINAIMSTAVVTGADVYEFWIEPMSDPGSELKELYQKCSKVWKFSGYPNPESPRLIRELQKTFKGEDFVILKYESWMGKLGPNPGAFQDFFFRNLERSNSDLTVDKPDIFSYKNPAKMDIEARKFASGAAPSQEFLYDVAWKSMTAAFSKSKIWIGFEIADTYQFAGIVHDRGAPEDAPCFSWCESDPKNPPGSGLLGPWAQSKIASHGKYVLIQEIALFRELIVRCNQKFMERHILKW